MRVAVTDANIFIDLIYLKLHDFLLKLHLEIYTTQQVLDELDELQMQALDGLLNSKCLNVYAFTEEEYEALSEYQIKKGLSIADHSVIFIAEKLMAIVLSGDSLVRKTCQERKLEVHGILWFIDECVDCNHLPPKDAHDKLKYLMLYNRRLPLDECEARLAKWATV